MAQKVKNIWELVAQNAQPPLSNTSPLTEAEMLRAQGMDVPYTDGDAADSLGLDPEMLMSPGMPVGMSPSPAVTPPLKRQATSKNYAPQVPEQRQLLDSKINALMEQYDAKGKEGLAAQEGGIGQLQQQINDLSGMQQKPDLSGLMGLADFLNNGQTHMKENYKAPESPQERAQRIIQLQNMLQERRKDLSSSQAANLKSQIDAYKAQKDDPYKYALEQAKIDYYKSGGNPASRQDDRLAQNAHNGVLGRLDHNKALQQKLQQVQGIDNASAIIEHAPQVTPQIFHDYQQALVAAINRGNSGMAERAERYMTSAGIDSKKVQQYLSGAPVDIGKDDPLLKATQGFAATERANINKQYNQIVDTVTSGQEHIYQKHPEMKKSLTNAVRSYKSLGADDQGAPPEVGEEVDGMKYLGGDPSKPESWGH